MNKKTDTILSKSNDIFESNYKTYSCDDLQNMMSVLNDIINKLTNITIPLPLPEDNVPDIIQDIRQEYVFSQNSMDWSMLKDKIRQISDEFLEINHDILIIKIRNDVYIIKKSSTEKTFMTWYITPDIINAWIK